MVDWATNIPEPDRMAPCPPSRSVAEPAFMQSVKILKRVRDIDAQGNMILIGDNEAESTDSRTFGSVPIKSVKGMVVCRWN